MTSVLLVVIVVLCIIFSKHQSSVQKNIHKSMPMLAFSPCSQLERFESLEQALLVNPEQVCSLFLWGDKYSEFPSEIRKFRNLREIDISNNNISTIPAWITELTLLVRLELSSNPISMLPSDIDKLKNRDLEKKEFYLGISKEKSFY